MRAVLISTILLAIAFGCARVDPPSDASAGAGPAAAPVARDNAPRTDAVGKAARPARADNCLLPAASVAETSPALVGDPPPAAPTPGARPLRAVRHVVVDPGHGGAENAGAMCGGVWEREVNLDVGMRLTEELRRRGFVVTITRTEDVFVGLEERAEVANVVGADLFISLHSNAAANVEASGIEVYFPAEIFRHDGRFIDDAGRARDINTRALPDGAFSCDGDLGEGVSADTLALSRELGRALGLEIERSMTKTLSTTSRGVKPAGFEVLRWTTCPAVLVEMGFLTNDADREKLADESYRVRIARSVAEAVVNYARLGESPRRE